MSASSNPTAAPPSPEGFGAQGPLGPAGANRLPAAEIDASCRWPLLLLFTSAVAWLVLGSALQLIVAIKLHKADFLADITWLTLGRLRPAVLNTFLYGFASQAGLGVLLWLFCRLGGIKMVLHWPIVVAWKLWNVAVTIGFVAILAGASTGFEWLEMPRGASALLFLAFALFGLCAASLFTLRRERELFPSQWFLLAGLFWFAWSYSAANYLIVVNPVRGTFQTAVNAWFTGNFLGLWLTLLALAAIFYFVPRLTGQPLHSRALVILAFWTQLFFGGFAGWATLITSPVPRWMGSVGTAGTICLLAPVIANAINWRQTLSGNCEARKTDYVLRFVLVGAFCYIGHGLLSALYAIPQVYSLTQFTYAMVAKNVLALHGFVAMALFGSLYYIVPRIAQVNWPKESWIRIHWICSVVGVGLLVVALTVGGILQGVRLANPDETFLRVMRGTIPFVGMSTLGVLLLLIGQLAFLGNLVRLLRILVQPLCEAFCAECCGASPAAKAGGKS